MTASVPFFRERRVKRGNFNEYKIRNLEAYCSFLYLGTSFVLSAYIYIYLLSSLQYFLELASVCGKRMRLP